MRLGFPAPSSTLENLPELVCQLLESILNLNRFRELN
jgi:hypothetical protein